VPTPRADARWARDTLRAAILEGEYLPGERLVEASVCERLGVSRFERLLQGPGRRGAAAVVEALEAARAAGLHDRLQDLSRGV